jgi:hypothetical protein
MDDSTARIYSATLEFLGKLAWPVVMLYVLYKFRVQLGQLLSRLGSVKVAGSEWVFQAQTDRAPEPSKELKRAKLEVGADGFLNALSIRAAVTESGLFETDEPVTDELLIFQTPNQRTWLVATDRHVFVLLDDEDTRRDSRLIQTFFDRARTLPIQCRISDGAEVVKFAAEDIWWYYSVHLFPTPTALKDAVTRLVKSGA